MPQLLAERSGHMRLFWVEGWTSSSRIYHARSSDGLCWSDPQPLPTGPTYGPPTVAIDAEDRIHVVHAGDGIGYLRYDGGWTVPDPSRLPAGTRFGNAALAVDDDARLHLLWAGPDGRLLHSSLDLSQ